MEVPPGIIYQGTWFSESWGGRVAGRRPHLVIAPRARNAVRFVNTAVRRRRLFGRKPHMGVQQMVSVNKLPRGRFFFVLRRVSYQIGIVCDVF